MARYRKVEPRVWNDAKFRRLSPMQPSGQGLWLYLLTTPLSNSIPGLFVASVGGMADDLGWEPEAFREAFQEVFREGLAKYDELHRVVYIPKAIMHNPPESPNVITSWGKHWDEIPDCQLKASAFSTISTFLEGLAKGYREAFLKAFREPLPEAFEEPSSNQEQEQEQEQEQNTTKMDRGYRQTSRMSASPPVSIGGRDGHSDKCDMSRLSRPDLDHDLDVDHDHDCDPDLRHMSGIPSAPPPAGVLEAPGMGSQPITQAHGEKAAEARKPDKWSEQVDQVIAHYQTHHPKAKPGRKERTRIEARLREEKWTVEELKRAIDGIHTIPHNIGENDRHQTYLDLDLIFRDSSHVQKYIRAMDEREKVEANGGVVPVVSDLERNNIQVLKNFLIRHKDDRDDEPREGGDAG